jgi:hypothetical protein
MTQITLAAAVARLLEDYAAQHKAAAALKLMSELSSLSAPTSARALLTHPSALAAWAAVAPPVPPVAGTCAGVVMRGPIQLQSSQIAEIYQK